MVWFVEVMCATLSQLLTEALGACLNSIVIQTFKQKINNSKIDQLSTFVGGSDNRTYYLFLPRDLQNFSTHATFQVVTIYGQADL